jgi:predicted DNA-binding protein with PD1-like motif
MYLVQSLTIADMQAYCLSMKYSQAEYGRVFVIRLEDGDILHEAIESFALEHDVQSAALIAVGGAADKSKLVVGPEDGQARPVNPMVYELSGVHEIAGTGTLFPNEKGEPALHMHIAAGRENSTTTGCVRKGVKVWTTMEIVLFELTASTALRVFDPKIGFELLNPGP